MDYMNAEHDVPRLVSDSERTIGARRIVERRWYDGALRRVNKTMEVFLDGQPEARLSESVRAYSRNELCALLEAAGFRGIRAFGDCEGRAYGPGAPRLILLAMKRQDA